LPAWDRTLGAAPPQRFDEAIAMLAKVEAECGRLGEGLAILDAQLALIEQMEQRWFDAKVHGDDAAAANCGRGGPPYGRARSLI
jgi:hypothetical protein